MKTPFKRSITKNTGHLVSRGTMGSRYFTIRMIGLGILAGALVGAFIAVFRNTITMLSSQFAPVYQEARTNLITAIVLIAIMLAIGLVVAVITHRQNHISGSGIPQVMAQLEGRYYPHWENVLPAKFVATILMLGSGLTAGREGPSVQIGASIGDGVGAIFKRSLTERRYLLSGGAAAGLAAGFNAPIAGVFFALETLHKNISPTALVTAMAAAFSATFIEGVVLGVSPVMRFYNFAPLPISNVPAIIGLGILTGLSGVIFYKLILAGKRVVSKINLPWFIQYTIPFVIVAIVCIFYPELFGSGETLVYAIVEDSVNAKVSMAFFIAKFGLLLICFSAGLPGGIFLPLLVLGALLGNAYGQIGMSFGLFDSSLIVAFIVVGMCGHLTAIVRSPLTAIILITEMTGSFEFMLPLGVVALVSYFIAELFKIPSIYESLEETLPGIDEDNDISDDEGEPVIFDLTVEPCSFADGKKISELGLPDRLLIVTVKRGSVEILPKGSTKLKAGDYIMCYQPEKAIKQNLKCLEKIFNEDYTIAEKHCSNKK